MKIPEITTRNYRIRLIRECERGRFNELIKKYHYLHSLPVGGRTIKVVCECLVCNTWLALIEFRSPPLGTFMYIRKRFPYVKESSDVLVNTRFLVLSPHYFPPRECHEDFKGSIALSKAVKLIKMIDKNVKVIVSYVDVNRGYEGKIYLASNFKVIGMSGGINIKRPVNISRKCRGEWKTVKVPRKIVMMYILRGR